MTIAERIQEAKNVNYEVHLWPTESIVCNADEFTFKIPYSKETLKLEWLEDNNPDSNNHHADIDDYTVVNDKPFLKDQFNKYIYLAEEIPEL